MPRLRPSGPASGRRLLGRRPVAGWPDEAGRSLAVRLASAVMSCFKLLEPSPVVALAREVYATVRFAAETTGLTRSVERVSLRRLFSGKVLMERRNTCTRLA